jgi:hypothetical protein
MRNSEKILAGNLKGRDHLGESDRDMKVIEWILKEGCGLDPCD